MPDERRELARIAVIFTDLDGTLDRLFASVASLKAALVPPGTEVPPVAEPQPRGALEAAGHLTAALEAMSADLKAVTGRLGTAEKAARRLRHIVRVLVISLVLDVALTIGVTVSSVQAHTAAGRANATISQIHALQIAGCEAGNQARAQQVQLWEHLVSVSEPAPGESRARQAAARRLATAFLAYVRSVFAPRNCQSLYRLRNAG